MNTNIHIFELIFSHQLAKHIFSVKHFAKLLLILLRSLNLFGQNFSVSVHLWIASVKEIFYSYKTVFCSISNGSVDLESTFNGL